MNRKTLKNPSISRALILSSDLEVLEPVNAVASNSGISAEIWDHRAAGGGGPLRYPKLRLVVMDDSEVDHADRSWLLARIRKWAPDARLLYVAAEHSPQSESQARRNGANYYLPKPVDAALLTRVLQSLIRSIR